MFFKKENPYKSAEKPYDFLIEQEIKLGNQVLDLYQKINELTQKDIGKEIINEQSKKYSEQLLNLNPLIKKSNNQVDNNSFEDEARNLQETLQLEILTKSRDMLLSTFIELSKICSHVEEMLVSLKENAEHRNVVVKTQNLNKKLNAKTNDEILNLIKQLNTAYQNIASSLNAYNIAISSTFMFKPSKDTPTSMSTFYYGMKDAVYKQTEQYQEFEKVFDQQLSQISKFFSTFKEYIKNHPEDIERLEPILQNLENNFHETIKNCKTIRELIDDLKQNTIKDMFSKPKF